MFGFSSWLRRRAGRRPVRGLALRLETLEDRSVPAGLFVAGVGGVTQAKDPELSVYAGTGPSANNPLVGFHAEAFAGTTGDTRVALGDVNGDGTDDLIAGSGDGAQAEVVVFDGASAMRGSQTVLARFSPYVNFQGGVFVAAADLNHDGKAEVITTPGLGGRGHLKIFNFAGSSGSFTGTPTVITSAYTFADYNGEVRVAALQTNGETLVVTASGAGVSGDVRAFRNADQIGGVPDRVPVPSRFLAARLKPFDGYAGGLSVAAGDTDGDGNDELFVSKNGGGSSVAVFDAGAVAAASAQGNFSPEALASFEAFAGFQGEVRLGAADVNGDGKVEVLATTGFSGDPRGTPVKAFTRAGSTFALVQAFYANPGYKPGAWLTSKDFVFAQNASPPGTLPPSVPPTPTPTPTPGSGGTTTGGSTPSDPALTPQGGLGTTVDTVAPTATLEAIDFVSARDVPWARLTVDPHDNFGYNPQVSIDVDLNHDGQFRGTVNGNSEVGYATGLAPNFNLPVLPEGTYSIEARVRDWAGNEGTSNTVTVQYDPHAGYLGSWELRQLAGGMGGALPPGPADGTDGNPSVPGMPGGPGAPSPIGPTGPPLPAVGMGQAGGLLNNLEFDNQGRVLIDARATLGKYLDGFKTDLTNLGANIIQTVPSSNMAVAYLPVANLLALENVPHFSAATPVYKPILRVGSVTTEGDAIMKTDTFRVAQSVDGTGIKVGVISDSVSQVAGGLSDSVGTGDLPSGVQVLADGSSGDTDEGRGMLEIVHDVAPGASLAFATANGGPTAFASNILALAAAGSNVITDDIGYANEPHFSGGRMGQAIDQVAASGVVYTSAAGNSGSDGYLANWTPVTKTIDSISNGTFQNFGGGTALQPFTLANGSSLGLFFAWDAAYLEGGDPAANFQVPNDLEVVIVRTDTNKIVQTFGDDNLNTDQAWEDVSFTNSTGQTQFGLAIQLKSGPAPTMVSWIEGFSGPLPSGLNLGARTIIGHGLVAGCITTGAVDQANPTVNESFSAKGGMLPLIFDDAGNRVPTLIAKPDVVAPDGVHTSFFGQSDGSGGFLFFGTSAAAPHAAGAAALLLQKTPTATPAQVLSHLETTAVDLLTAGFDNLTGFGRIQITTRIPGGPGGPGGPSQPDFPIGALEPNETSDAATDLAIIGPGSFTQGGLAIGIINGVPDYDWYFFGAGVSGTYNFSLNEGATGQLEIHVFRQNSDGSLSEVAASNSAASAAFQQGTVVYVEVRGVSTGLGTYGTGNYTLSISVS